MSHRRGFALLTVLWVMVGIAILAIGAELAGRNALATARNRTALTDAYWKANGCLERARAAATEVITTVPSDAVMAVWDSLDHVIATSPLLSATSCTITTAAAGAALDINTADAEQLQRFFTALNIPPSRADSLIDALLDWRDSDSDARPLGAEHEWYAQEHRLVPRDSLFADVHELLHVRGFEQFGDTLTLLTTENTRMPLSHTPLSVLASLPGMTPEALARAADFHARGEPIRDLLALSATLPHDATDALLNHYAELARRTTPQPDAWLLTATATSGDPAVHASVEVRLARAGTRIAILRRR